MRVPGFEGYEGAEVGGVGEGVRFADAAACFEGWEITEVVEL